VLAVEADVDRVVMGTLVRSGDQLRATAQLVEAPGGTLLTSHTIQSSLGDLFRLQDDLARRVVDALSLPLTGGPSSPAPDAPHNARAYEFYLRANEMARTYAGLPQARDLYLRALELDPRFAPAWARLGRCQRVISKFIEDVPNSEAQAEDALKRAIALDPRLSVAHKFYAQLESDTGRSQHALVRLVREANHHGNDPELFAGLVHTCRYCGLYDRSIGAHAEARRLDPNVTTSLTGTLLMNGDLDRLLTHDEPGAEPSADEGLFVMGLGLAGRRDEARERLRGMSIGKTIPAFQSWSQYLLAWIECKPTEMLAHRLGFSGLKIQDDPEAMFLEGWLLCDAGEPGKGLPYLERAVAKGYCAAPTLANSRHFDRLRGEPAFQALLAKAEALRQEALAAFHHAGGDRLF
jgi:tetratricopeptide (TPR) repeat protein